MLIQVHDIPNAVESFYSVGQWTGSDGTTSIGLITAGHHRVEMTVPAGFAAGPTRTLREIDIAAGGSIVVQSISFEAERRGVSSSRRAKRVGQLAIAADALSAPTPRFASRRSLVWRPLSG